MFRERPQIMFHQSPVDCYVPPNANFSNIDHDNQELSVPLNEDESLALAACKRAIELKEAAGTLKDRTYNPSESGFDDQVLSGKRRGTFLLAHDIAKKVEKSGTAVLWYDLADVSSFVANSESIHDMPTVQTPRGRGDVLVRLEESLAVKAERLVEDIKAQHGKAQAGIYSVKDDLLVVTRGRNEKTIPLHGYSFNRSGGVSALPSEYLPHLPSCEAFIAATVLDQTELSSAVVRVVPYWMRDREVAARDLLRSIGHNDLPVLSVIAGDSGDVEKVLPWSNDLPSQLEDAKTHIKERAAHQISKQVTKAIHDRVYGQHRELYRTFNRPELDSNISPSSLLDYPYLSQRAHEFLSRTLVAAPLYETGAIKNDSIRTIFGDVLTLIEIMSRNYQPINSLSYSLNQYRVRHHTGINTNDVTELSVVLAGRPEEDNVLMPHSKQIDLVGHFVFEQLPANIRRHYQAGTAASQLLLSHFLEHPPKSVLLEARRIGSDLKPL